MDFEGIGRVAANTTLAACAGALVAVFFVYPRSRKWDVGMTINGFLGGLVAITAPCYWVTPGWAIVIGGIAGVLVPLGVDLLERLRIDDPIGAVPVHGICGIWGTLAVGLFAGGFGLPGPEGYDDSVAIEGLFNGGGTDQLVAQAVGSISCVVVVGLAAFGLMFGLRRLPGTWNLRLGEAEEVEGIDIAEHGLPAYHMELGSGFAYTAAAGAPKGLAGTKDLVGSGSGADDV
jgi:Amt family ammonium transporter